MKKSLIALPFPLLLRSNNLEAQTLAAYDSNKSSEPNQTTQYNWNPPKTTQDMLIDFSLSKYPNSSMNTIYFLYDTNNDGNEDTRMLYIIKTDSPEEPLYLLAYAIDNNKDTIYSKEELAVRDELPREMYDYIQEHKTD